MPTSITHNLQRVRDTENGDYLSFRILHEGIILFLWHLIMVL